VRKTYTKGQVLVCPVCKAEVTILAGKSDTFVPICCQVEMVPLAQKLAFYRCEICGAEIAVLIDKSDTFTPICCNEVMQKEKLAA
jgi:hypothetical protein